VVFAKYQLTDRERSMILEFVYVRT